MTYYGQSKPPEDQIADAVFGDFIGTCVEVGAYNGIDLSNTYYFYRKGWRCINFEPHPENYAKLCIHQPEALNVNRAVVDYCYDLPYVGDVMKTAPGKPIVTGFDLPEWYIKSEVPGGASGLVDLTVFKTTIDFTLRGKNYDSIDYVSIDTDGTELHVLRGFDVRRWQPRLFIVEYNHALEYIMEFFEERGYQLAHTNSVNGFWTRTQADYGAVQRAVR